MLLSSGAGHRIKRAAEMLREGKGSMTGGAGTGNWEPWRPEGNGRHDDRRSGEIPT